MSYGSGTSSRGGRRRSGQAEERSLGTSSRSAASIAARSSSLGCGVISKSMQIQANVTRDRDRSQGRMGRRLLIAAVLLALVPTGAAAASSGGAGAPAQSWAAGDIRAVTAAGLMGNDDARASARRIRSPHRQLEDLVFGLKETVFPPPPVPGPPPVDPAIPNPTVPPTSTTPGSTTTAPPTTTAPATTTTTVPSTTTDPTTTHDDDRRPRRPFLPRRARRSGRHSRTHRCR